MNKERNKEILVRYAIEGQTMQEIGDSFGISRERVRQILEYLGVSNCKQNNLRIRAKRLYDFLVRYKKDRNGSSPTIVEMVYGANLSTSARVKGVLRALEGIGLIKVYHAQSSNSRRYNQVEIIGSEWIPPKDIDFVSAYNQLLERKDMKEQGR